MHAPKIDRARFYSAEEYGLNDETDKDYGEKPGENGRRVEIISGFKDVPTDSSGTRGNTEHKFRRNERTPGEGPSDFETGKDRRKSRRN